MTVHAPNIIQSRFAHLLRRAEDCRSAGETASAVVRIGMASCGLAAGAREVREVFEERIARHKLNARVVSVGCMGHCHGEPLVSIEEPGAVPRVYQKVTPAVAGMIAKYDLQGKRPVREHLMDAERLDQLTPVLWESP